MSTTFKHGTRYGYAECGCRCELCKQAHRSYMRSQRRKRYAERQEVDGRLVHMKAPHGTKNGYGYYGCRCERCFTVQSDANRARPRKGAQRSAVAA